MRKLTLAIAAVFAAFAILAIMALHNANAATLPAKVRTCAAFNAWNHHRTVTNLNAMLTASESAPWNNLGNDVDVVYADVRGNDRIDLPMDARGIAIDCKG